MSEAEQVMGPGLIDLFDIWFRGVFCKAILGFLIWGIWIMGLLELYTPLGNLLPLLNIWCRA